MLCRSALLNPWSLGRLATSTSNPNHPTTSLRLFAFLVFAPTPLSLILSSPQQIIHRSKAHDITTSPSSLPRFRPNAAPILSSPNPTSTGANHTTPPHILLSHPPASSRSSLPPLQVVPPASRSRPLKTTHINTSAPITIHPSSSPQRRSLLLLSKPNVHRGNHTTTPPHILLSHPPASSRSPLPLLSTTAPTIHANTIGTNHRTYSRLPVPILPSVASTSSPSTNLNHVTPL
jgi:hypothetical protein